MNNPTKIIIIDLKKIEEEAAEYFDISLDRVELRHIKVIKALFHSKTNQWNLAEERSKKI